MIFLTTATRARSLPPPLYLALSLALCLLPVHKRVGHRTKPPTAATADLLIKSSQISGSVMPFSGNEVYRRIIKRALGPHVLRWTHTKPLCHKPAATLESLFVFISDRPNFTFKP